MRITNPVLLTSIILLMSCRKEETIVPMPVAYDIILVAGQSNTHFGYGIDSTFDQPDDAIFQLGRSENDHVIIPAVEPLDHYTKMDSCIGFALTFAKLYRQEYLEKGRRVLIIPCGISGTSFIGQHWNSGNQFYIDAVSRTNYALSNYPASKLVAILWHQGESDEGNLNYQNDLDLMITQMRSEVLSPDIPFILGGMVPYWVNQSGNLQVIQQIISETPQRLTNCGYANPDLPFTIDKGDNSVDQIHYDANGQRELGRRYFVAFRNLN